MIKEQIFLWLFLIGMGFLSGSVMFCWFMPRLIVHKDVCQLSPDHNPGAANVFMLCGVPLGLLCLLLDMGKGFFPIFLALRWADPDCLLFALVMAAPVLGHAIAPFNKGQGGKCIATSFGELIALLPETPAGLILAGVYITFSTIFKIDPNRRRSIVSFGVFAVAAGTLLIHQDRLALALGCILIAGIAIFKHWVAKEEEEAGEAVEA